MSDLKIDTNERGKLCDSIIRRAEKSGLSVERETLVVGDYLLGAACIEAKSINDLFFLRHGVNMMEFAGFVTSLLNGYVSPPYPSSLREPRWCCTGGRHWTTDARERHRLGRWSTDTLP